MRRNHRSILRMGVATAAILGLSAAASHAVIVATGDGRNIGPPPAPYVDAWNLEGQFGLFLATPIDSRHFITAAHITNTAQPFYFQNHAYATLPTPTNIAGTDLRIWTIDTSSDPTLLPAWAPIWDQATDGSEVGKEIVVFGRGLPRGQAIYAPISPGPTLSPNIPATSVSDATLTGPSTGSVSTSSASAAVTISNSTIRPTATVPAELRGWTTANAYDGQQSWGRNVIDATDSDPNLGDFLVYDFDRPDSPDAIENEAGLATYDSGGAVFILSNGTWKLAGINYGTDSGYAASPEGLYDPSVEGGYARNALMDVRGLYTLVPDGPDADSNPDIAQVGYGDEPFTVGSYSTRVSTFRSQILSAIGAADALAGGPGAVVPEPATAILLAGGMLASRRRRR